MKPARFLCLGILLTSAQVHAQGAVIETLDDLRLAKDPPELRSVLPVRAEVPNVPPPREQAETGTCTSWSVTYAAASQAARRKGLGSTLILSPAFTYNVVSRDRYCHGPTSISKTLELLSEQGALPIDEFAFDPGWCGRQPTDAERKRATTYRIKTWSRFDSKNIDAVKAQLVRGAPVIFSMRIGTKMRGHRGEAVLEADEGDFAGHAMIAVGYDDMKKAFRIQNSWGSSWGDGGYAWFSYDFWKRSTQVAFVID
jgi:C1A family cysteine protease